MTGVTMPVFSITSVALRFLNMSIDFPLEIAIGATMIIVGPVMLGQRNHLFINRLHLFLYNNR